MPVTRSVAFDGREAQTSLMQAPRASLRARPGLAPGAVKPSSVACSRGKLRRDVCHSCVSSRRASACSTSGLPAHPGSLSGAIASAQLYEILSDGLRMLQASPGVYLGTQVMQPCIHLASSAGTREHTLGGERLQEPHNKGDAGAVGCEARDGVEDGELQGRPLP